MKICSLSYLIAIGGYKYHHGAVAAASSSSVTAEGDVVSSVTSHQVSIVVMFLSLERDIVDIVFWAELKFVRWGYVKSLEGQLIYVLNSLHDIELM